jgi:hypothetical protein
MKKIILILISMLVFVGCSTTKKVTETNESKQLSFESNEDNFSSSEKFVDTTKTESGKITITEIEFYPPNANEPPPGNKESPKSTSNVSGLSLPNVGNIGNASIKSIKQTTIEKDSEKKGESKESSSITNVKNEATLTNTEKTAKVETSPAPDPYRWRYIFYILLLGTIAFLYFKRIPVLNWIKTILSNIRRIF